jgi:hypothetical protein
MSNQHDRHYSQFVGHGALGNMLSSIVYGTSSKPDKRTDRQRLEEQLASAKQRLMEAEADIDTAEAALKALDDSPALERIHNALRKAGLR